MGTERAAVISRVADHCFWFGRYLERTESTARILLATGNLALDGELPIEQLWPSALVVCGERPTFIERFGAERTTDGHQVQRYMSWDEKNFVSILQSVRATRENARSIRDVLSLEVWERVNELYLWVEDPQTKEVFERDRIAFYARIIDTVQLALGFLNSTMLHDAPLDFILLGMLLERAGQVARTLDVHHHALVHLTDTNEGFEGALWLSLLKTCSGVDPFMRLHQGRDGNANVPAFLILEPRFPRSIVHCLSNARERLLHVMPSTAQDHATLQRLDALIDHVQQTTRIAVGQHALHGLFTRIVEQTARICEDLAVEVLGAEAPKSESEATLAQ